MKIILFCLLFVNFQVAHAQEIQWFEGSLVMSNGDVFVGEISIEYKHNLVLFQKEGSRMVYPAHRIRLIYLYDKVANVNRRFISLRNDDEVRKECQLYEVVVSGEINVLRRKKASAFPNHNDALDYNYFVSYKNKVSTLAQFNRIILRDILADTDGSIKRFLSVNKLRGNDTASSIRIIEFYNNEKLTAYRRGLQTAINEKL